MLTLGDFDERIFLGKDADAEIGTPAGIKTGSYPVEMDGPTLLLEAAARSQANPLLQQHIDQVRTPIALDLGFPPFCLENIWSGVSRVIGISLYVSTREQLPRVVSPFAKLLSPLSEVSITDNSEIDCLSSLSSWL